MSVLEVKNITKAFGKKEALKNVQLTFEKGHCYGVLGNNGAGKSTLFRAIMKACPLNGGSITLDGREIRSDALRQRIFCVGAGNLYPAEFSVKSILEITHVVTPAFDLGYAKQLIERFGLSMKAKYGKLSTGEETLLLDALALASGAEFIILDEPVLGVDVAVREIFYKELAGRMEASESAYIISTHLVKEIEPLLEYIIVLKDGQVIVNQPLEEVYEAYTVVSGKAEDVDMAVAAAEVIGTETIGMFKRAYVRATAEQLPDGPMLTKEPADLQETVKFLIGGGDIEN